MATLPDQNTVFGSALEDHLSVIRGLERQMDLLEQIARLLAMTLHAGNQILWCGNGGSAGDSQHLAAEIVGRFRRERRGLPSIALTTDSSILTAVANDYGFEAVFSRQVEALGRPGDVLIAISTSGNSHNVIAAVEKARELGLTTIAFTGAGGGRVGSLAHHLFAVDSHDTARVQEAHLFAGHMICDWLELDCIADATRSASHLKSGADVPLSSMEASAH